MSKLLKSKFLLGVLMVVAMFALTSTSDAAITSTLRKGSRSTQVTELQQALGVTPATGYFGNKTLAAVKAFQTAQGLTADGVFGPMSRAKLVGGGIVPPVVGGLPAGCLAAQPAQLYSMSLPNTPCIVGGIINPPVTTGPVSVALAADTPASGTAVTAAAGSQAGVDLAHFVFNGTGTVTNVTLKRIGISSDSLLNDVYLYDGNTRLTDSSSVTSGSMITFNNPTGLFTLNGPKTISVRADLLATSTSGETVGVQLVGFTASGQTAATLSSPISGIFPGFTC